MVQHDSNPACVRRLNVVVETSAVNSTKIPSPVMINHNALLQLLIVKRIEYFVMTQFDHNFVYVTENAGLTSIFFIFHLFSTIALRL